MPEIPQLLWNGAGPVAVVIAIAWLLFTGRIRTAREVRDLREDRDARLAEAREQITTWRQAYEMSEAARAAQADLLRETLEVGRTVEQIVRALRQAAGSPASGSQGADTP